VLTDCSFVTCADVPNLDPDDRLVLAELQRRGYSTAACVWSDDAVDWSKQRLCVVRSTWDYHRHYPEFLAWIERVAALTAIRNRRALLCWNADKAYLSDLAALGVPTVPTVRVERGEKRNLSTIAVECAWRELVVKPSRGAAAHDVLRVAGDDASWQAAQRHLDRITRTQAALIQPYLRSVATYGERALIFFGGHYSHAAQKKPFDTVWVVNGAESAAVAATPGEIAIATAAIALLPNVPLYARVDLLQGDAGETYVSEVELVEPGLYIGAHPAASSTFADAIERELHAL